MMKQGNFILIGLILLFYAGLIFYIDSGSSLNTAYEDAVQQSNSSPSNYISGLRFEENQGQCDTHVKFMCRDNRYVLYLTSTGTVIQLSGDEDKPESLPLSMTLANANVDAICRGQNKLESHSNYFRGNDPEFWITNVPQYQRVKYDQIYEGIDLVYYMRNGHVEFDFIIGPGFDPAIIQMDFEGAQNLKIGGNGNLIVNTEGHELVYKKPLAWQGQNEDRCIVDVHFAMVESQSVYFELGEYDRDEPLVIDPELVYASFLGGSDTEQGLGIALDDEGCVYITGSTLSPDFPVTPGSVQPEKAPGYTFLTDVFVSKFAADGSSLIYSTYLGGYGGDHGNAIAVDGDGNAYITGMTYSHDNDETPESESFPTMNAYQEDPGSIYEEDVFLTKLNGAGNGLLYSTYLAGDGEDEAMDIAIDEYGNAYITGVNFSFDYPIRNAVMPNKPSYYYDGFVTKVNPSLAGDASLIYSTYLGGEANDDYAYGIAVDRDGHAYVTGVTESNDFPTKNALQSEKSGTNDDAFVTKLSADGASYVWSTYLGGTGQESGKAIVVDTLGNAYATGRTSSFTDFPVTSGVVIETPPYNGVYPQAYVTKFNPEGTGFEYSTFSFAGQDIALDEKGSAYVIGVTNNPEYPIENPVQDTIAGGFDIYIMKLNPTAESITFSSFLGGTDYEYAYSLAVDSINIYLTGVTSSPDFPVTSGAFQLTPGSNRDAFAAKIVVPREEFVVEVWQDPLNHEAARIPETAFDIYSVDPDKPEDPFELIESRSTDDKGFLYLPASMYEEGSPFLLRKHVHSKKNIKDNHDIVNNKIYDVYVDNLHIDSEGRIYPDYLPENIEDTTETYMEHTWIGINLVVSTEWPATKDYMDQLKMMLRQANSCLYDVTNGQAALQNIAVYDNFDNFFDTDVKLHASNVEWPRAHVKGYSLWDGFLFFPPSFFGTEKENVNNIFKTPIELNSYRNYTALTHEIGHYVFGFYDEYMNADWVNIYPDSSNKTESINFGFMDNMYDENDPMSSEMSWFETEKYQETAQYTEHHATCWDYFREQVSGMYGSVRAEIHTPLTLGFSEGENVEGPSSSELGVGSALNIIDETGPDGGDRIEFLCKNESGDSLPGVNVRVWKQQEDLYLIKQGKTVLDGENKGKIRLFGAEPGDEVQFTLTGDDSEYQFEEILVEGVRKSGGIFGVAGDATVVVLKTLKGQYRMLSEALFDISGNLRYETTVHPGFSENPTLEVTAGNTSFSPLTLTGTESVYIGDLSNISTLTADLEFRAKDVEGTSFFVPQNLDLIHVDSTGSHLVPANNSMEMWLDTVSPDLETLAILGSEFPSPEEGLPDSTRRISPVISVHPAPLDASFEAKLRIFYKGDTLSPNVEGAVTIFRWEDEWVPLTTNANLQWFYASAKIDKPGIYAVFLDLTRSHVTGVRDRKPGRIPQGFGLRNYPNPFNASTFISFDLAKRVPVNLSIYNTIGQKIETLISAPVSAGHHEIVWESNDLPVGTYFIRLSTDEHFETKKMSLLR